MTVQSRNSQIHPQVTAPAVVRAVDVSDSTATVDEQWVLETSGQLSLTFGVEVDSFHQSTQPILDVAVVRLKPSNEGPLRKLVGNDVVDQLLAKLPGNAFDAFAFDTVEQCEDGSWTVSSGTSTPKVTLIFTSEIATSGQAIQAGSDVVAEDFTATRTSYRDGEHVQSEPIAYFES